MTQQNPLPTIEFVGGETQELVFNTYHYIGKRAVSLIGCSADFSIVPYLNGCSAPVFSRKMALPTGEPDNRLSIVLLPADTANLSGKYIYQITITGASGEIEIPRHGALFIFRNINISALNL